MQKKKGKIRKSRRKQRTKLSYLAVIILVLSLVALLFSLYLFQKQIIDRGEVFASMIIGDSAGFDLNLTALTFGRVIPGSSSDRRLTMNNAYPFPVILEFSSEGDITEFLTYNETVYVAPYESKNITFLVKAPLDAKKGVYTGKVFYVIKKDI